MFALFLLAFSSSYLKLKDAINNNNEVNDPLSQNLSVYSGIDERFKGVLCDQDTLDRIGLNLQRKTLLDHLVNPTINDLNKLIIIEKHWSIIGDTSKAATLSAGGLLDDWNNTIF